MSVVPLLLHNTMEDPLADTMDVASPYPGHVDDFEIEIDIMEDQAGNVDIDFDVQDASPAAMQQPETTEGPPHDADMMDDVPDSASVDPGSRPRNDDDFYSGHVTYESEMLDEEYDEDIDAPVPEVVIEEVEQDREFGEELSAPQNDSLQPPEDQGAQSIEEKHDGGPGNVDTPGIVAKGVAESDSKPLTGEDPEHESAAHEKPNGNEDLANPADTVDLKDSPVLGDNEAQPSHASQEGDAVQQTVQRDTGNQNIVNTEPEYDFVDESHGTNYHERYLHPVKVLYQGSEISMFPPREGDSSETFFLENEALAYEEFGSLLVACRHVLGDHASDEESLVVDVDSLSLQITEDNIQVSKVTLSQLVDIYLRLCHNDGTENPEPLFLSLSTKPSLSTEISSLISAADEGKGISQIQSWDQDDLHQEDRVEESLNEADNQAKEPLNATSNTDPNDGLDEEKESAAEETAAVADQAAPTATDAPENDHAGELEGVTQEDDGHIIQSAVQPPSDAVYVPSEERYDSEDHTESTGTVVQTSLAQSEEHEPDETTVNPDQDYFYLEDQNYDDEGYEEEETAPGGGALPLESNEEKDPGDQGDDYGDDYGDDGSEEECGEVNAKDANTHDVELQSGEFDDPAPGPRQDIVDNSEDESTPQQTLDLVNDQIHDLEDDEPLEESYERRPDQTVRQTPELADDFLDLSDDIFASPDKNAKQADANLIDEPRKVDDGEEHDHGLEDFDFEEDYIEVNDLGPMEDGRGDLNDDKPEFQGNSTGKRSRDSEDEVDLSEAPTPDAKRSRSS